MITSDWILSRLFYRALGGSELSLISTNFGLSAGQFNVPRVPSPMSNDVIRFGTVTARAAPVYSDDAFSYAIAILDNFGQQKKTDA